MLSRTYHTVSDATALIDAARKLAGDFVRAGFAAGDVEARLREGLLPLPGAPDAPDAWTLYQQALVKEMRRLSQR